MTDSESGDSSGEDPEGSKVRRVGSWGMMLSRRSQNSWVLDPGGELGLKKASFLVHGQLGHIQDELAFSWQGYFWLARLTSRQGFLA